MELNTRIKLLKETLKMSQMSQISAEDLLSFLIPYPKELKFIQQRTQKISYS